LLNISINPLTKLIFNLIIESSNQDVKGIIKKINNKIENINILIKYMNNTFYINKKTTRLSG